MLNSNNRPIFEILPEEKTRVVKPASILFTLCIAAFTFIVINFGILSYLKKHTPNLGFWLIDSKWSLLLDLDQSVDVLILGDSTANQGLVPEVIGDRLGVSAINLGTVASLTVMNDVWMLDNYLESHDPPRIVLIMHSYQVWDREISKGAVGVIPILEQADWRELLDPSPMEMIDLIEERILYLIPSYSQSYTLRILTRTVLQIPPDFGILSKQHYTMSELGTYSVFEQDTENLDKDILEHLQFLDESQPSISPDNFEGLESLKKLSRFYDFQVLIINAPIASEVAESPLFPIYFSPIQNELQNFWDDSVKVHYIPDIFPITSQGMESADHMLADSAREFTLYVINEYLLYLY